MLWNLCPFTKKMFRSQLGLCFLQFLRSQSSKPLLFGRRPRTGLRSQQVKALGFCFFSLGLPTIWKAQNREALVIIKASFLIGTSSQFLLPYTFFCLFLVLCVLVTSSLGHKVSLNFKKNPFISAKLTSFAQRPSQSNPNKHFHIILTHVKKIMKTFESILI